MVIADKQGNAEIFRSNVTDTITDTSYIIPTWDMTLTSKVKMFLLLTGCTFELTSCSFELTGCSVVFDRLTN